MPTNCGPRSRTNAEDGDATPDRVTSDSRHRFRLHALLVGGHVRVRWVKGLNSEALNASCSRYSMSKFLKSIWKAKVGGNGGMCVKSLAQLCTRARQKWGNERRVSLPPSFPRLSRHASPAHSFIHLTRGEGDEDGARQATAIERGRGCRNGRGEFLNLDAASPPPSPFLTLGCHVSSRRSPLSLSSSVPGH